MKIFIAGATGAIGRPLVRTLVAHGHEVVGMTRSAAKGAPLRAAGADFVVADAFDRDAVTRAVAQCAPDAVVNELTALESVRNYKKFDKEFALTNRLRTEGTDNLRTAAQRAGARIFLSQSFGSWVYERGSDGLRTETDPLISKALPNQRQSFAALQHLEKVTLAADGMTGIVLRYAGFYGPGTSLAADGYIAGEVRKRHLPIVGKGTGVWSFIHVDDAADATVAALEAGVAGVFNIVDDEPAPVREWLPFLTDVLGAKPPRHVPVWLARLAAGEIAVHAMTEMQGMSNEKAKSVLAWQPEYPSYRDGFRRGFGLPKAQLRSTT